MDKQSASTHRAHRTRHPCHATQRLAGCAALIQPTDTPSPHHPVGWKSATRHIVLILTPCARQNP